MATTHIEVAPALQQEPNAGPCMSVRVVQVFCFRLAAVLAQLERLGRPVSRLKGGSCLSVVSRGASAYTRIHRNVQANALKAFKVKGQSLLRNIRASTCYEAEPTTGVVG